MPPRKRAFSETTTYTTDFITHSKKLKINKTPTAIFADSKIPSEWMEVFNKSSNVCQVVCRENEENTLKAFVQNHKSSMQGGCIILHGSPGTGKSSLINKLYETWNNDKSIDIKRICGTIKSEIKTPKQYKKFTIYIIEEFDKLPKKTETKLLNSTHDKKSNYIIIGLCNTLPTELTLDFYFNKINTIIFNAYTEYQIFEILKNRCNSIESEKLLFNDEALKCCAKSVANSGGDIRKALDYCYYCLSNITVTTELIEKKDEPFIKFGDMYKVTKPETVTDKYSKIPKDGMIMLMITAKLFFKSKKRITFTEITKEVINMKSIFGTVLKDGDTKSIVKSILEGLESYGLISITSNRVNKKQEQCVTLNLTQDEVDRIKETNEYVSSLRF